MRTVTWLVTVMTLAGTMSAQAAPWLGLVGTNTTTQTSASIASGTLTFSLDLRMNSSGYDVGALQYYITTTPANAMIYGATPLTAKSNPFVTADLTNGYGHAPTAAATVNSGSNGITKWFKTDFPDYPAFPEQTIATYQFDTSALGAGTYVLTPIGQLLSYGAGEEVSTFATPGSFTLNITAVPEPGASMLMLAGGFAAAARNRRRIGAA